MIQPSIRNPSLKNLSNEKWKDMPEFEGYYQISSYGRVKSLSRDIVNGLGVIRSHDRILMPNLNKRYKKDLRKYIFSPSISLSRDGILYSFTVARLVYILFVEKFDYYDRSFIVTFKNGDTLNLYCKNLIKTTYSELYEQASKGDKTFSHISLKQVPITQYDAKGNPIAWYESAPDAAKKTGFTSRVISYAANGTFHIYKGFFWRTGKNKKKLNVDEIKLNVEARLINEELIKHLGLKKVDTKNPPPYLNLSLNSVKGEVWKDIPGYEGLYQASNFGRVKSLQKVSEGKVRKWKPEQIKALTVLLRTDRHGKRIPGRTMVMVCKHRKKKHIAVHRYVYYLFVKKFDLNDPHIAIFFNDANPLNLHHKNLYLQWIARDKKVYKGAKK
jgi:hypothetical protein